MEPGALVDQGGTAELDCDETESAKSSIQRLRCTSPFGELAIFWLASFICNNLSRCPDMSEKVFV